MTGPQFGLPDAITRFRAAVDGVVSRGRQIAAEERDRGAVFGAATRALADDVKQRTIAATKEDLTPRVLRDAAAGFRTAERLPVDALPDGEELIAAAKPKPKPEPAPEPPRAAPTYEDGGSILTPVQQRAGFTARRQREPPALDAAESWPPETPSVPSLQSTARRRPGYDEFDEDDFSNERFLY